MSIGVDGGLYAAGGLEFGNWSLHILYLMMEGSIIMKSNNLRSRFR